MLLPLGMEAMVGIVAAGNVRALRDQEMLARYRVVDRLGDLADDLTGKVTTKAGDQGSGDDTAGFDLIGRNGSLQALLKIDITIGTGIKKSLDSLCGRWPVSGEQVLRRRQLDIGELGGR